LFFNNSFFTLLNHLKLKIEKKKKKKKKGNAGFLKYQDTSTGELITQINTKLNSCHIMTQNPSNAVIHLGHSNG